jgi:hypothetical protein
VRLDISARVGIARARNEIQTCYSAISVAILRDLGIAFWRSTGSLDNVVRKICVRLRGVALNQDGLLAARADWIDAKSSDGRI